MGWRGERKVMKLEDESFCIVFWTFILLHFTYFCYFSFFSCHWTAGSSDWISDFSGVGPPETALMENPPCFFFFYLKYGLNPTRTSAQRLWWNVKIQHLRYYNGVKCAVVFLSFCRAVNGRAESGFKKYSFNRYQHSQPHTRKWICFSAQKEVWV